MQKVQMFSQWNNQGSAHDGFFTMLMATSEGWRSFRTSDFEGVWEDEGLLKEDEVPTPQELKEDWQQWGVAEAG